MADPFQFINREISMVEKIGALLSASVDSENAQKDLETFWDTQESMENLKRSIEAHSLEEMSTEERQAFQASVEQITGLTFESFGMEHLYQLDLALQMGGEDLMERLRASYREWVDQLGLALEKSANDFRAVLRKLPDQNDLRPILVGDHLQSFLAVDGTIPASLPQYFSTYSALGRLLLSQYVAEGLKFGSEAALIIEPIQNDYPDRLEVDLYAQLSTMGDPRRHLSPELMSLHLPGGRSLFAVDVTVPEEVKDSPAFSRMYRFFGYNAPTSPVTFWQVSKPLPEGSKGSHRVALSVAGMRNIAESLDGLFEMVCPNSLCDAFESIQTELVNAMGQVRRRVNTAPDNIKAVLETHHKGFNQYLELGYTLTVWPTLLYLTNLCLVTVGLTELFERCIAKDDAVSTEGEGTEPEFYPDEEGRGDDYSFLQQEQHEFDSLSKLIPKF